MDSELLSVFRDDQFDCSGSKFDENYWNIINCENFETQLSNNLNGILPISPVDEKITCFDGDLQDYNYSNSIAEVNDTNIKNQKSQNFSFSEIDSNIEIIAVDPNADFDDAEFDSSEYEKDEQENNNYREIDTDNENKSQISFRSRTESSSIGDYESHTSDESEVEHSNKYDFNLIHQPIYVENENKKSVQNVGNDSSCRNDTAISHIDFVGSSIMVATNNSNQSIEIDTETFDLATFITEDNFIQTKLSENSSFSNDKSLCCSYGYESEEMIDIETIDDRTKETATSKNKTSLTKNDSDKHKRTSHINLIFEEDDIKGDPSWDPSYEKKNKNCTEKPNEKANNKNKENNINKNLMKDIKTTNNLFRKKNIKILKSDAKNTAKFKQHSHDLVRKCGEINDLPITPNPSELLECSEKHEKNSLDIESQKDGETDGKLLLNAKLGAPAKKKLNLEEYYRMRQSDQKDIFKKVSMTNSATLFKSKTAPAPNIKEPPKEKEHFSFRNLSNSNSLLIPKEIFKKNSTNLDPITEAKNKVLRMQEMKRRAAQKRLIDITVSSKVGPVTKILPLEEIIKPNFKKINKEKLTPGNSKVQIEYEEIIIVSVSCNTDIKIPPKFDKISVHNNTSNSLLYNISNTIEKVRHKENLKISNNSLITSIKNVVLQKTVEDNEKNGIKIINYGSQLETQNKNNLDQDKNPTEEHGEDKIIMHLPKNRIRNKMENVATQTELLPEFPSLELMIPKTVKTQNRNRKKKCKTKYSSLSSNSDRETDAEYTNIRSNNYRSHSRSTSGGLSQMSPTDYNYNYSCPDSKFKSDLYDLNRNHNRSRRKIRAKIYRTRNYSASDQSTSSSYRSRSSSYSDRSESRSNRSNMRKGRRSKSNHKNYRKTKNKGCHTENSPAVEERRIVYVGRIETETTKEDLKKKFIGYGPIKQITLHYKDTGMKYGFVTFEKAEDAFKAIDNGTSDVKINMYDISFGGRRAFCRQSYADLDGAATNTFQLYSYGSIPSSRNSLLSNNDEDDSFESLLKKVQQKLCSSKSSSQNI
ncbi:NK-tumor recognition protein [Condylostylus longicornis]|uniref:NK-tumor recognition protein n=1 Tax=Condylostylus longicornis TaxID=2530218 RepID=UPI00244DDD04|nr:NK-tumor recognition protein [Condylostylus longicornis]XP_055375871.1 NK-tumor recognition protein [Condylostylus longicornis]